MTILTRVDHYAGPIPAEFDRIPAVLKDRPQWVLWRGVDKVDKKTGELRGYPETLSLHCSEITQHPCGNETPDDHHA